jgi:hypothetical protein
LVFLIEYVAITVLRKIQKNSYRQKRLAVDRKLTIDLILLAVVGLSMLSQQVYIFSPLFEFTDYTLPGWTGWLWAFPFAMRSGCSGARMPISGAAGHPRSASAKITGW